MDIAEVHRYLRLLDCLEAHIILGFLGCGDVKYPMTIRRKRIAFTYISVNSWEVTTTLLYQNLIQVVI